MKEEKPTFLIEKTFSPLLNVFPYTKVTILSFISFILSFRKYTISTHKTADIQSLNSVFVGKKRYILNEWVIPHENTIKKGSWKFILLVVQVLN